MGQSRSASSTSLPAENRQKRKSEAAELSSPSPVISNQDELDAIAATPQRSWLLKLIKFAVIVAAAGAAGYLLFSELEHYSYHDIAAEVSQIGKIFIIGSLLTAAANYLVLSFYDALALQYVGKRLPYFKVAVTSFIGYAFSHNIGFPMLSGAAIRYRLYSAWGFTATDVAQIMGFNGLHFWLGYALVTSGALFYDPSLIVSALGIDGKYAFGIAALLMIPPLIYIALSAFVRQPIRFGKWLLPVPPVSLASAATFVAVIDWILAAAVLQMILLSQAPVPFAVVLACFAAGQIAGVLSHVPAGLGVFESVMLIGLRPWLDPASIVGSLLVYRGIYYLFPFAGGVAALGAYEIKRLKPQPPRILERFKAVEVFLVSVVPPIFSLIVSVAGAILLFSGATPTEKGREWWIADVVPLPVVELSHFSNSVIGATLLGLAWALKNRIETAYRVSVLLLAAGIVVSLLKGLDYEEATFLTLVLGAFLPCRGYFYRKASLFSGGGWSSAVALIAVLASTVWLGFFSYKHVEYSHELWWQFAFNADASRFLRSSIAASLIILFFSFRLVFKPGGYVHQPLGPETSKRVAEIVASSYHTNSCLVWLGDKYLLFDENGSSLIMYRPAGASWIALGDPIGDPARSREMIWQYLDLCDRNDVYPVFYEVAADRLPNYVDAGLALLKLGEEAIIPLDSFTISGNHNRGFRHTLNRLEKEGYSFVLHPKEDFPSLLPELQAVSAEWMTAKRSREKGFSLGFFDPAYLSRFPTATVERNGEIAAFANVWETENKVEISVDLMRQRLNAPTGVMDFLFLNLMLDARQKGFAQFNLGMAPFSGLERHRLAPLWVKLGSLLFEHGEHFYNFEGLRAYKEKYNPRWQPRYLAAPGGIGLPVIFANIATLISGGLRGVLRK